MRWGLKLHNEGRIVGRARLDGYQEITLKRVTPRTSAIIQDTLALILAGGQGERLYPLTKHRAKPAVPFGGIYRIIDFALSNCINSQLKTDLRSDSIQIRFAGSPHSSRLEHFFLRPRRVHLHDSSAIPGLRKVVSGNGRRCLSEHLHHRARKPRLRPHSVRRSHLQNGLQRTAGVPCRSGRRCYRFDDRIPSQ